MKYRSSDCLALVVLLGAGCFNGTDNVPHASGGGGAAATGGDGGSGGAAANGGAGPGGSGSHATSSGSGGNGGGAPDPCANSFFCDDFESYPTASPPGGKWTNYMNGGTVTVDSGRAHSGTKAVKVSAGATDSSNSYRSVMISLADASLLPPAGDVVYGRMMFFLESAPTGTVHWTFIDGYGQVPGQSYHALYRYGGQLPITDSGGAFVGSQLMANYDTPDSYGSPAVGPSSDCWLHANKEVVPVGKWSCVEWEFDTPNNSMHFWLDGNALADLTMTDTGQGCVHQNASFEWLAPTFSKIDLGWESYQADDARTIWIDDVALGTQRLHCPQ